MQVKDLKPAGYNPRKISKEKLAALKKSLEEFGDLSGIVFNIRTQTLIGGHQRTKNLDPSWPIVKESQTDKTGTVAAVTYREFEDVIAKDGIFLRTIRQNAIRDYLLRSGFVSWKDNQQIHSHKELLKIVWNDPRHRISIQRHSLFTVIGRDGKPEPDQDGNVRLWFDGHPNLSPKKGVKSI